MHCHNANGTCCSEDERRSGEVFVHKERQSPCARREDIWRDGLIDPVIFNIVAAWRWVVSFSSATILPKKSLRYRNLSRSYSWPGHMAVEQWSLSFPAHILVITLSVQLSKWKESLRSWCFLSCSGNSPHYSLYKSPSDITSRVGWFRSTPSHFINIRCNSELRSEGRSSNRSLSFTFSYNS